MSFGAALLAARLPHNLYETVRFHAGCLYLGAMHLVSRVIVVAAILAFACGELSLPTRSMAETV